jgi:hypothetical protein
MKFFSILSLLLVLTLLLTACGAGNVQTTPTFSAADIQATIAAAAMTMIIETQAAIPTATPPPPTATFTNTPAATITLPPLPSLEATFTSVPSGNSRGNDPCINQTLPATLQGEPVSIRIHNSTDVTLALSVYLNQTTPQVVCGYRTYTIDPEQTLAINNLVEGCFTLWAWNPDQDNYFIVTNGASSCLDRFNIAVFNITKRGITLR